MVGASGRPACRPVPPRTPPASRSRAAPAVDQAGTDALAAEHPGPPPPDAVGRRDRHDPSVVGLPAPHVGDNAGGAAAIGRVREANDPERAGFTLVVRLNCRTWVVARLQLARVRDPERRYRPAQQSERGRRRAGSIQARSSSRPAVRPGPSARPRAVRGGCWPLRNGRAQASQNYRYSHTPFCWNSCLRNPGSDTSRRQSAGNGGAA